MISRKLADKLTFQKRTLTTQPSGQVVETFSTMFSRWGFCTQQSAGEVVVNDQQQSNESYKLALAADKTSVTVTSLDWRVIWRDQYNVERTLNITGVTQSGVGRAVMLHLIAAKQ